MEKELTYFERVNWTKQGFSYITLSQVVEMIRTGENMLSNGNRGDGYTLKDITEFIQSRPEGIDIQKYKLDYLPAVCFNGVYNGQAVGKYSHVTAIDFDHIPGQDAYSYLYTRLMSTPCVVNIYRTPSGRGLKAIILHDNDNIALHEEMYGQLLEMFDNTVCRPDPVCFDINRRHYLCYDPDIWTNLNPVPFHFISKGSRPSKPDSAIKPKPKTPSISDNHSISDASIMNMLKSRCKRFHPEYLVEGQRRIGAYWFGTLAKKAGVDYDYGLCFVTELYNSDAIRLVIGNPFTDEEIASHYTKGYEDGEFDDGYRDGFNFRKTGLGYRK